MVERMNLLESVLAIRLVGLEELPGACILHQLVWDEPALLLSRHLSGRSAAGECACSKGHGDRASIASNVAAGSLSKRVRTCRYLRSAQLFALEDPITSSLTDNTSEI